MIEEIGVVVSVEGDMAEVEGQRRGVCGGCTTAGACGTPLIADLFGRRRSLLWAYNAIGAEPGDRVVIGLSEGALLEASFLAYLVPLSAMIGGAIAGVSLGEIITPAHAQSLSIVTGLGGLAGALAWLSGRGHAKSSELRFRPQILRYAGPLPKGQVTRHPAPDHPE